MYRGGLKRNTIDIMSRAFTYLQGRGECVANRDLCAHVFVDIFNTFMREASNPDYPRHDKVDREYKAKGVNGLIVKLREYREKADKDPLDGDMPYENLVNGVDTAISILQQGKRIEEYDNDDFSNLWYAVKGAMYSSEG